MLILSVGSQLAGGAAFALPPAQKPIPPGVTIPYPGQLVGDAGQPVAEGVYDFSFALYDAETGGEPLWSEVQKAVAVRNGAFTVSLGSVQPIPSAVLDGGDRWLAVAVRGPGEADFTVLTPRQHVGAAAAEAAAASGLACPHNHFGETWTGSNVNGLVVQTTYGSALIGHTNSAAGQAAVWGIQDNAYEGAGVEGDGEVIGVWGIATGVGPGGSMGVLGQADSTTGDVKGIMGETWSTNAGVAVVGVSHGNRHAGWFDTGNFVSVGMHNNSASGATMEVSNSTSGGPAAKFWGNVFVYGNLSKSGGGFQIDNPLDPANQYLNHSFVESPDRMNVYNGNAVLDGNGEAWVDLPRYFETLNRDFRYQLTPIGAPAPNLYIAEEISGNRFKIAGGPPGIKVSWQVTGVRQDPWAEANPIVVEEEKSPAEQGSYIHPGVYSQPESAGIVPKEPTDP
jgi:hypothetical protein